MQTITRILLGLIFFTTPWFFSSLSVNPVSVRQSAPYLKPPFKILITLADNNEISDETPSCPGCSRIFSNAFFTTLASAGIPLQINAEGPVSASFRVPDVNTDEFNPAGDANNFDFSGAYQAGKLNGSFIFDQVHKMSPNHFGPQSYQGGGEIVTLTPITGTEGGGTLSGWFEYTEWVAKGQSETQRFEFEYNWQAVQECPCACQPDSQARFTSLTGTVEITCNPDEVDWRPANLDDVIFVGDHIATRKNSSAIIQFADYNTYVMSPDTEIVIDSPPEKETKLQLVFGRLWNNTKKLLYEGTMTIETSQAVLGIKGTTFVLEHAADQTILKVIAGEVSFTSKADGQTVAVHAGEQAVAGSQGLGKVTTLDIAAERQTWLAFADEQTLKPAASLAQAEPAAGDATPPAPQAEGAAGKLEVCGIPVFILGSALLVAVRRRNTKSSPPAS